MIIKAIHTSIFKENSSLIDFICSNIKVLEEKSVLVITSKIVALSEGRVKKIEDEYTREKLIKSESQWAMKTKYTWLTIKDGVPMSSAGIDESNANGKIILLPRNSFNTAESIRSKLKKIFGLKNLGVVISDSRVLPLRAGITGVALGYSGFLGIKRYRGQVDIFGRFLKVSKVDIADSLATAAVLTMGEGAEQQPLALISSAPIEFKNKTNSEELKINIKEDLYQPLFEKIKNLKIKKKKNNL